MSLDKSILVALSLVAFFFPFSISLTNLSLGALSFMILALMATKRCPWKTEWNPALKALVAYSLVGMFISAAGLDPRHSIEETGKDWHKPVALTIMLVSLRFGSKARLERVLAASFGLASLIGLYQSATQRAGTAWVRAHAFVHPVTYGEMFACVFLGALCFWGRREAEMDAKAGKKWLAGFLVLTGAALILNQTRGAVLGLAAGYAAVCWFDKSMRRRALTAAGVLVAIALIWEIMPTGGRSLRGLLHSQLYTPSGSINPNLARYEFWSVAWRIFLDHPLFGVGQGNFKEVFTRYAPGINYVQNDWGSAHDLYLHQLAERGLLGFGALCAALGALTVRAYARARANPNVWNLWAWGAMVAFLVMNLTEVAFQNELVTTFFLFVWAWAETNREIPAGKVL